MNFKTSCNQSILSLSIFLIASLNANAESGSISGSSTMSYNDKKVTQISEANGQMLQMAQSTGVLKSKGPMDGAKVVNDEVAQLFQGNGDHIGYYTVMNSDGSTVTKWNGKVNTVMKDGNPITTFKGKWEYISGSGKYKNIKGNGDYNGYFTAADTYVVDWKGNYKVD